MLFEQGAAQGLGLEIARRRHQVPLVLGAEDLRCDVRGAVAHQVAHHHGDLGLDQGLLEVVRKRRARYFHLDDVGTQVAAHGERLAVQGGDIGVDILEGIAHPDADPHAFEVSGEIG